MCRQPASVRLFHSGAGFVAVSEVLVGGVSSSCLLVATQAASVTSALFRYTQTCMLQICKRVTSCQRAVVQLHPEETGNLLELFKANSLYNFF